MTNDRYLFRGFHKCDDGSETIYIDRQPIKGKWVYGSLVSYPNNVYEIWNIQMGRCCLSTEHFKVIPETIGQYTGLEDINGKKIFENDYLKFKVFGKDSEGYVSYYIGQFYIVDCGGYSDYNFLIYTDMEVTRTKFDKEVKDND